MFTEFLKNMAALDSQDEAQDELRFDPTSPTDGEDGYQGEFTQTSPNTFSGVKIAVPDTNAGRVIRGLGMSQPSFSNRDPYQMSSHTNPFNVVLPLSDTTDTTNTSQPSQTYSPIPDNQADLAAAQKRYSDLSAMKPEDLDKKKDNWLKNAGKGLAITLAGLEPILNNPNLSDGDALKLTLGRMLGGVVGSTINPYYDEKVQLDQKKAEAKKDILDQQGLYSQNLANLQDLATVQDTYAKTKGREADAINDANKTRLAYDKYKQDTEETIGKNLQSTYKSLKVFNPETNPDHAAMSEQNFKLFGFPLPEKRAGVRTTTFTPDAVSGTIAVTMVMEDGNVAPQSGYLMQNGSVTDEQSKAGKFEQPVIAAARLNATSREKVATLQEEGRNERAVADLKFKIAALKADTDNKQNKRVDEIDTMLSNLTVVARTYGMTKAEEDSARADLEAKRADILNKQQR